MPPQDTEQARWFAEEVQPHEPLLRAWLRTRFSSLRDIDDLIQETYLRLCRARSVGAIARPKSYLFAMARNAALDRVRRERAIPFQAIADFDEAFVLDKAADSAAASEHEDALQILAEALRALPPRCREVLVLRKFHGLSYDEIAARLGISKNTVNVQVTLGTMRCREFFRTRGLLPDVSP